MVDDLEQVLEMNTDESLEEQLDKERYQTKDSEVMLDEIVENASQSVMYNSMVDDFDYSAIVGSGEEGQTVQVDLEAASVNGLVTGRVYTDNRDAAENAAENLDIDSVNYELQEKDGNYKLTFRDH